MKEVRAIELQPGDKLKLGNFHNSVIVGWVTEINKVDDTNVMVITKRRNYTVKNDQIFEVYEG